MSIILLFILQLQVTDLDATQFLIKNNSDITRFTNKKFEDKSVSLIITELEFTANSLKLFKESQNTR